MIKHVSWMTFALLITACAHAWADSGNSGGETPEITITTSFPASVTPGMTVNGEITIQIPKGWHLYAPGKHKYTALSIKQGAGPVLGVNFTYPPGVLKDIVGERVPLYEGQVGVKIEGRIAKSAKAGKASWRPEVTWQACTETICLAPETGALTIEFNVDGGK